ncbi:helix-turn-helix domain-containing protein [Chengkuizengella sp. SCS-71B]|uniref:helix-turn-helix domain-containing protein n=1 Tax=Chengkuizengella sp. SCS-71B TaxID=3115290 RepID=UPI0032C22C0B
MEKNRVAQRIRAFRKLKGYTQTELAVKVGISISKLGSIERGSIKPDEKTIQLISEALYIDAEELKSED